ncbi:MAG TPA: SPOR domain-containing protein [Castellaniella sp.]|uniref:SPOR domain-containing protein n=1 Tax=Castellaniella sp. TaxID=1955812 RepID=UPI002EEF3605
MKELRAKARRRLIGALVLVLAAVIIVPWFFQEPVTDDTHAPVVVPAAPTGILAAAGTPATGGAPAAGTPSSAAGSGASAAGSTQGTVQSGDATPAASGSVAGTVASETPDARGLSHEQEPASNHELDAAVASVTRSPEKPPQTRPAELPKRAEPAKPARKPVERTDDGSVALALLSGKSPEYAAPSKAAPQGKYFLQLVSYNAEQDAQARRDSLRQAGVTDAYVERGQASGRTVYRLRVGPFGSHEAAQAAQARLRALGYQNSLISAN